MPTGVKTGGLSSSAEWKAISQKKYVPPEIFERDTFFYARKKLKKIGESPRKSESSAVFLKPSGDPLTRCLAAVGRLWHRRLSSFRDAEVPDGHIPHNTELDHRLDRQKDSSCCTGEGRDLLPGHRAEV